MSDRRVQPPPKHSAATSHHANARYIEDWEAAYQALAGHNVDTPGHTPGTSAAGALVPTGALMRGGGARGVPAPRPPGAGTLQSQVCPSYRSLGARCGVSGSLPDRFPPAVTSGWHQGPASTQGVMCNVSDRPNSCSCAHWPHGELVVGSTDHALYVVDAAKGTHKRTLFSKACGHSEWVTTCCFLPTGQVVSGAMDSKLWLWPAGGVRGTKAHGHAGPISKVRYEPSSGLVASASYDQQVKLWDCSGGQLSEVGLMAGHQAPVLEMEINPDGLILTGDRSGNCFLWDSGTCEETWHLKHVHKGHVTALAWADYNSSCIAGLFVTGGQDGMVRAWDPRDHTCVAKQELHVNGRGRGAVGDLAAGGPAAADMLVSAGADGTLCVSDPRSSFGLVHQIQLGNFPYSMAVAGGLALVGCGDGSLWVLHISTGQVRYCLGASKHAVRCIEACEDRLMASGDDGRVLLWSFA